MISGIRYREGLRWRAIPAEYGPRTTLFNRFDRWSQRGLWQDLLAALSGCAEPPDVAMVDSTAVRAHRSAAGAKGGSRTRPPSGQARGPAPVAAQRPRSTRSHGEGRLYALMLSAGQVHDVIGVGRCWRACRRCDG